MRRALGLTVVFLLSLCWNAFGPDALGSPPAHAAPREGSTLVRLERALDTGVIDHEQYLLYRLYRVVDRGRIPESLRAAPGQERPVRCSTMILREVLAQRPHLSDRARQDIASLGFGEPTLRADSYWSDNFELIVGSDGTTQANIDTWLQVLETVWDAEVTQAGFAQPPCTDTAYFPVYLANTGPDVYTLESDTYGYVSLDNAGCPYMVVHAEFPGEPDPEGVMGVTAAHEFQHGIQAAYNWDSETYWAEGTAVWAEEYVYDHVDDYLQYLNGTDAWLAYPERSLLYEDGWHEYGTMLWAVYLDESHGGPAAIVDIWQRCAQTSALQATDDYLYDRSHSLAEAFVDFTTRVAALDFVEGDQLDPVYAMASHGSYPAAQQIADYPPASYGANYIVFDPAATTETLHLRFSGQPSQGGVPVEWGVALVLFSGASYTTRVLSVAGDGTAQATVDGFGGEVDQVILAVSVLGDPFAQPEHDAVPYGYEARLAPFPRPASESGCGCAATPRGGAPGVLLLLLALWLWRRRAPRA